MKLFLVSFSLVLCRIDSAAQQKVIVPKKIVFENTTKIDNRGLNAFENMIDSAASESKYANDSLAMALKLAVTEMFSHINNTTEEIHLEVIKDTTWRVKRKQGSIIGNYERIDSSGLLFTYSQDRKALQIEPFDIFKKKRKGESFIDKNDVKTILGFECYRVILEIPEDADFGNNIFEMYVTDLIALPPHAIIYVDKVYPFFPLEIKTYSKNMPGIWETIKAISIEK